MTLAQKVAFNTTTQIAGRIAGILVSLVTLRVTTGYLGAADFGELAIVLAVGGLVLTVSDLGVTTTLARELSKRPDETDRLAATMLSFRIGGAVGVVAAALVVVPFLPYASETRVALAVYLVGTICLSIATFPKAFFQTALALHRQAAIDLTMKVVALTAVGTVAALDLGFLALVVALATLGLVELLLAFTLMARLWRPSLRWDRALGMSLARSSLAVGLVSMIGVLHFRGDAFLLSLLAPARDVGIYAIAFQFIGQAFILPGFLVAAVFPILTRAIHQASGEVDTVVNRTLQALALGSAAVGLAVFTLARPLIDLVAGPGFEDAVRPTRILALSLPFLFCAPVFYSCCIAVNRQRSLIWVGLASLCLNVGLNLVLIPRYTYDGAAVATVVSEATALVSTVWVAVRHVELRVDLGPLVRIGFASLAGAVAGVLLLQVSTLAACAGSELLLFGVGAAIGAFRPDDLRLLVGRGTRTRHA